MKKSMMTAVLASPFLFSPVFAHENVPDTYGYIGGHASQYFFYDNEVIGDVDGLDDDTFLGVQPALVGAGLVRRKRRGRA